MKKQKKYNKSIQVRIHQLDWLEWTAIVFSLWLLIYPHPYKLLFIIVLLFPIIGLILNGFSRPSIASLVSISREKGQDKYDLADFIDFPAMIIAVRVLLDFEFESLYSILKVGTVGFILSVILISLTHKGIDKSNKHRLMINLTIIGNMALYAYAATYGINCVYDNSEPLVYHTKVMDKSVTSGKRTNYYLEVRPWGNHAEAENISVNLDRYNKTALGDTVNIYYKKGLLNIPWYRVE